MRPTPARLKPDEDSKLPKGVWAYALGRTAAFSKENSIILSAMRRAGEI